MTRKGRLGMTLLSIWLILWGLLSVLGISYPAVTIILALLSIAAGLTILLDIVTGPTVPIDVSDPRQYIGTECIPVGSTRPTGARIKVLNRDRVTLYYWDFNCDELADAMREVDRINQAYCINNDATTPSATVAGTSIQPFQSTTTGTRGITLSGPNGLFLFPCAHVPELIRAMSQAFSGCCL